MPLTAHIQTLEEKHTLLDEKIAKETARPLPDFTIITALKKQKLLIKEEISRLSRNTKQQYNASS